MVVVNAPYQFRRINKAFSSSLVNQFPLTYPPPQDYKALLRAYENPFISLNKVGYY